MRAVRELDRVLRGEATTPSALRRDGVAVSLGPLVRVCLLLAASYGLCMGVYGLFRPDGPEYRTVVSAALKVPALFALTILITFPSLYVFNTLLGSRLEFGELLRLVVSSLGVVVAVLAAFGPIVAFFSVTTTSYPFVLLLNVAVFAGSGLFGLAFLRRALLNLSVSRRVVAVRPPPDEAAGPPDAEAERPAPRVAAPVNPVGVSPVFYVWMGLFAVVGAQMGWVLRPFVGTPDLPFTWFRHRESSFFEGMAKSLRMVFWG